ncbi:hypothetical protein SDC9_56336 [bioreactor metagenome]|uniref:DUF1468 domain-containing protein n=1 Tax=bioreactor metagenome TaxID=1076179 RepID=A0A644X1J5_9ZZZZ
MIRNKEKVCGLLLFAIGVIFTVMTARFKVTASFGDPGPQVLPYIGSITLIVCGCGIFFRKSESKWEPYLTWNGWKKIGMMFSLFIVYVFAMKYIGYIICTPIVLFTITTMFAKGKNVSVVKRLIFTIIVSVSVYYLFVHVLHVMLPSGSLF